MPPADIDALAGVAARLSRMAYNLREDIAELDLDPVMVLAHVQGAFAVDALQCAERHERIALRERPPPQDIQVDNFF
ncbi:MAG: acetate--CoA ligase family protein [Candidatus Binatia bacterium]